VEGADSDRVEDHQREHLSPSYHGTSPNGVSPIDPSLINPEGEPSCHLVSCSSDHV
jgi:hypothetical protein